MNAHDVARFYLAWSSWDGGGIDPTPIETEFGAMLAADTEMRENTSVEVTYTIWRCEHNYLVEVASRHFNGTHPNDKNEWVKP